MGTYIFITISIIVLGVLCSSYKFKIGKRSVDIIMIFAFAILCFFLAFRGDFTADYNSYTNYFTKSLQWSFADIMNVNNSFVMERGFVLLGRIIGMISTSPVFYMFCIGALTLFFYFKFIGKWSQLPWLSILLFATVGDYYASYNLMRQVLVAAIFLAGMEFLKNKTYIKYVVFVLLLSLIHVSAIAMIPIGFLLVRKINFKQYLLIFCGTVVLMLALPNIISFVQQLIPRFSDYEYGMAAGSINSVIPTAGIILFSFISIYIDKGCCEFDVDLPVNRICLNATIFSAVLLLLGATQVYMVARLAYFLKPFSWILTANILASYKDKRKKTIYIMLICLLSLAFVYITMVDTGYNPYYFIWTEK